MSQLFGEDYVEQLSHRFTIADRDAWPTSVVIALDPDVSGERNALEFIFSDLPQGKTKKKLLQRLRAEDDDTFVGGWSELKMWALLKYRGLKPILEPAVFGGTPDFGISWPVAKGKRRNGLMEVFAASAKAKSPDELRKKVLDRLQCKASKYSSADCPYIVAIVIGGPPCSSVVRLAAADLLDLEREAEIEEYRSLSATLHLETFEIAAYGHRVDTEQTFILNENARYPIDELLPQLLADEMTDDEALQLAGGIESGANVANP